MGIVKKILRIFAWLIIISFQIIIGFIAAEFGSILGYGEIPLSIILMWLGITLSEFLIGILVISLHRTITPKRYRVRLVLTACGVLFPLAIVSTSGGFALNADNEILSGTSDPEGLLLFSSFLLGLIGFYSPNWIRTEKVLIWTASIIIVGLISFLVIVGYVQGYYVPESERLMYDLDSEISYSIDPETILSSIDRGEVNVFMPAHPESDEYIPPTWVPGSFSWSQKDHMKVANSLHQLVWNESLADWHLIQATFMVDQCHNVYGHFDHSSLYFYKQQEDSYIVRSLWINLLYGDVTAGESIYANTRKGKSLDLDDIKVASADTALQIAEENGGKEARLRVNEECDRIYIDLNPYAKHDILSHPFNLYDWGWEIYYSMDGSIFDMTIDPYTGKYRICNPSTLILFEIHDSRHRAGGKKQAEPEKALFEACQHFPVHACIVRDLTPIVAIDRHVRLPLSQGRGHGVVFFSRLMGC